MRQFTKFLLPNSTLEYLKQYNWYFVSHSDKKSKMEVVRLGFKLSITKKKHQLPFVKTNNNWCKL